jgi:hypothetical protein
MWDNAADPADRQGHLMLPLGDSTMFATHFCLWLFGFFCIA